MQWPARTTTVLLLGTVLAPPSLPALAPQETGVEAWIREMDDPDPFAYGLARAEILKLGDDALVPLASRVMAAGDPAGADSAPARTLSWLRLEEVLGELLDAFLGGLESEYRSLALDRREFADLERRQQALETLRELRPVVAEWRNGIQGFLEKAEVWLEWRALDARRTADEQSLAPEDAERWARLQKQVEAYRREVPEFDAKVEQYRKLRSLEASTGEFEAMSEAAKLHIEELRTRIREREPRVEALLERLHAIGLPAYSAVAARRQSLPLEHAVEAGDVRSFVERLYDEVLEAALLKLTERGELFPSRDEFDRVRYHLSAFWALQAPRDGAESARAEDFLARHLERVLEDLSHELQILRDRAAVELYRLGPRGLAAIRETSEPFLEGLLRWRIHPAVYRRIGIHFNEYERLDFAGRKRRIFQYARAAGEAAIPTLRAIVADDSLEPSFLVKYAAAKALAMQVDDHWGLLVLRARHPELVLRRPEVSRDFFLLQGLSYVRSKDYTRAVEEFRKVLDEFPFDFEGNYQIAFSYLLLKDYARAIHYFEIARRIQPNDQLTLYNLACAYSLGGRPEKALEALEASVEAGFDDPEHMEKDPDLDPIRGESGYQRILQKCRERAGS